MRYWWVNQNQTFEAETKGGYLWSPKRNANGARNQFYENMREVSPGDLVFSFCDTRIAAVGCVRSHCYESNKPEEFNVSGRRWSSFGWKVDVVYRHMIRPIRPKDHIQSIRPLLPKKYSPLQETGDGLQSVYLAEISPDLAKLLLELTLAAGNRLDINQLQRTAMTESGDQNVALNAVDDAIEQEIRQRRIPETEKEQLIQARRGQGRFRENVAKLEKRCRITGVSDPAFLVASHIKPWRSCEDPERLDGENGLFLSPAIDFLFDRGYISFADDGRLLLSSVVDHGVLAALGVPVDSPFNAGTFTRGQQKYLAHHRREIFLKAGSTT